MRLGLISDVHGQLDALLRALDLLQQAGADRIVCAGDLVDKGPHPNEVVTALNENLITTVLGNHDEAALALGEDADGQRLTQSTKAFLTSLPELQDLQVELRSLWLTHAVPGCTGATFDDGPVPKPVKRALRHNAPDAVIFGHHHAPICRRFGRTWLINPGSVCRGRTRDSHTCGLLDVAHWEFTLFEIEPKRRAAVTSLL